MRRRLWIKSQGCTFPCGTTQQCELSWVLRANANVKLIIKFLWKKKKFCCCCFFFQSNSLQLFPKDQSFKRKRKVNPLSILRFYLYIYQDILKKSSVKHRGGCIWICFVNTRPGHLAVNELTMTYTVYQSQVRQSLGPAKGKWSQALQQTEWWTVGCS